MLLDFADVTQVRVLCNLIYKFYVVDNKEIVRSFIASFARNNYEVCKL